MTAVAVTYYTLTCDSPGCTSKSPDEGSDYGAWADPESAREQANYEGNWIVTSDGRDLCVEHHCLECEAEITPENPHCEDKHWWSCHACHSDCNHTPDVGKVEGDVARADAAG